VEDIRRGAKQNEDVPVDEPRKSAPSDAQYLSNGIFASTGPYGICYDTGSLGAEVEVSHYFTSQWRNTQLPSALLKRLRSIFGSFADYDMSKLFVPFITSYWSCYD
jgi:hypothetical protein